MSGSSLRLPATILIVVLSVPVLSGCQDSPTGTLPTETLVGLDMSLSTPTAGPGQVITIQAKATKTGPGIISYARVGCDPALDVYIEYDGKSHYALREPQVCIAFPEIPMELPSDGLSTVAEFNGSAWLDGSKVTFQEGDYRIVAAFTYFREGNRERIETSRFFRWASGAP